MKYTGQWIATEFTEENPILTLVITRHQGSALSGSIMSSGVSDFEAVLQGTVVEESIHIHFQYDSLTGNFLGHLSHDETKMEGIIDIDKDAEWRIKKPIIFTKRR
jgi:hypothetical protein